MELMVLRCIELGIRRLGLYLFFVELVIVNVLRLGVADWVSCSKLCLRLRERHCFEGACSTIYLFHGFFLGPHQGLTLFAILFRD